MSTDRSENGRFAFRIGSETQRTEPFASSPVTFRPPSGGKRRVSVRSREAVLAEELALYLLHTVLAERRIVARKSGLVAPFLCRDQESPR